jgi:glycosyltransferase involved in cell wall biosynthesis
MSMMNILMVTDFYWPFVGGVEQHVRRLSHALASRGNQVAVVTLSQEGLADFEYDGEVRVYRVRSAVQRLPFLFVQDKRRWAPPFPDPGVTRALRRILALEKPHIIHGHDWLARSFLPLKTASGAKFVMSLHYYTLSCAKKNLMIAGKHCSGPRLAKCLACAAPHYGALKGIPITLANWIMSAAERAAVDRFIAVSQATAEGNGLTGKDRFEVIPNFMPDDRPATADQSPYLAQLPQEPFLLFVGDLRRDKGLEVLLEAYRNLTAAPPLVLVGKAWAETPAEFLPGVTVLTDWPNEAVLAAWERSLIGIVPSLWPEPFGIVVIEAMAAGRPVVASRTGGIPDLVQDGETGLLFPPGDAKGLRLALEKLLGDPPLRERMGRAGKARAAAFQAAAVVPRIEQVYRDLLHFESEPHEPTHSGQHYYQQL